MKRALTITDITRYKPQSAAFEGRWLASIGKPELRGCWLIWGASGSGKTTFALQLCKYLSRFCRVAYNSLEQGLSLQRSIEQAGMGEAARRFVVLDKESIAEVRERLRRQSPQDVPLCFFNVLLI